MSIEISENDLFAKIGMQAVEIDVLRGQLARTERELEQDRPPEPDASAETEQPPA